ncbi:MAG TPA: sigma-70 family RNA polymerase sigma factor, partial [Planctomycetota bacterium]|nr:sigma-70 family RNA polymerase sigma factor [Planctomycetota bacterium]
MTRLSSSEPDLGFSLDDFHEAEPKKVKSPVAVKARRKADGPSEPSSDDPLGIYLKDVGSHDLLQPEEEHLLLGDLIFARNRWIAAFLGTERGLTAVWSDLEKWKSGEMAARSLVPGPPKPKPGREDSEDHVSRLYRIFARHVARRPRGPFKINRRNNTNRLLGALLFVGLRPGPLKRYRDEAVGENDEEDVNGHIRRERSLFVAARRPLIERNLRLVLSVARKFDGGPLAYSELIQEGNLGLIRATESFSARFGVRFSTYAYLWIRQAILRALEDKSRTIRLPVNVTQSLRKVAKDDPEGFEDPSSIKDDSKRNRLTDMLANPSVSRPVLSLDYGPEDESRLGDLVGDGRAPTPDSPVIREDIRNLVKQSLKILPDRHRLVLRLRFGIDCSRSHTLAEIGKMLGVSAERIRQIEASAFERLRKGPDGTILEEMVS